MTTFDFQLRTRVLFGTGVISRLGELTREQGARRVLMVTDRGIVAAGHAARAAGLLGTGVEAVDCFDGVRENPDTACVDACLALAREFQPDLLIGLGGGSAMDTAKGCNFLLTNGGRMQDYRGVGKATRPMLPLIAIPTTAGTGSECQSAALITDPVTHQKMACLDPKAAARVAILDPELTLSLPGRVALCTGLDAVAHAVETAVTRPRNPVSQLFSEAAFRCLSVAFARVLAEPQDLEARGEMLLGAAWAGTAIENSMLGAAHAAANPLTAHHGITHGEAVALMLPHVVRFNAVDPAAALAYHSLLATAGEAKLPLSPTPATKAEPDFLDPGDPATAGERLARWLEDLLRLGGLEPSLASRGISGKDIPSLAGEAAAQWTAGFNPRPVTAADFETLYRVALSPDRG
ncbi:MAG: iron-containing alcohol dehydrogenase [Verrucomicrobiales bacterium]|nr:iron-containing alcohol dehydrogenase [Verrucomicrobiales bacterium]